MNARQDSHPAGVALTSSGPEQAPPAAARKVLELFQRTDVPSATFHAKTDKGGPEALATALGCESQQIALTSIFRGKTSRKPLLLIHAAPAAVSDKILSQMVGETIQRAEAEFAVRCSGYHTDAIAPLGLSHRMPIIFDNSLTRFTRIWVSLGEREWYASVPPLALARAISARIVSLAA